MTSRYRTAAGSRVAISGKYRGIVEIEFDWFEEGACCEARPVVVGEMLTWSCACCRDGGSAALIPVARDGRAREGVDGRAI